MEDARPVETREDARPAETPEDRADIKQYLERRVKACIDDGHTWPNTTDLTSDKKGYVICGHCGTEYRKNPKDF